MGFVKNMGFLLSVLVRIVACSAAFVAAYVLGALILDWFAQTFLGVTIKLYSLGPLICGLLGAGLTWEALDEIR